MIYVCGRKVRVLTGQPGRKDRANTQTVRICSGKNIIGEYDYIIRLYPPNFTNEIELQNQNFRSIKDLVEYLVNNHYGKIEKKPHSEPVNNGRKGGGTLPTTIPDNSSWDNQAICATEDSIDQLVLEFIEFPYLHRVESSIHCELYKILSSRRIFGNIYFVSTWTTQLVHKEWPEHLPRPEKGNRRGNFDLCILSLNDLKSCIHQDFRDGRIEPLIAIEIGLNCNLVHLKNDAKKLINSKIKHGYLVHLVRTEFIDDFDAVEKFILEKSSTFKIAYARKTGDQVVYKLTNDKGFQRR